MKHWWKILSVILILYSLVGGLMFPLGYGVTKLDTTSAKVGEKVNIEIQTYNIPSDQLKEADVFLRKSGGGVLQAQDVIPIDDTKLKANFNIPLLALDQITEMTLIVATSEGYAVLPSAIFLQPADQEVKSVAKLSNMDLNLIKQSGIYFPFRNILLETIRNTYYHIPMWFAMVVIMLLSCIKSVQYLTNKQLMYDFQSSALNHIGLGFGLLGLLTGALWAKYTWGEYWSWDPKQTTSLIVFLVYCGYFLFRNSIADLKQRAQFSNVYNIFAFGLMIPLLFVVPRMMDSLHPGSGGNPAMGGEDLDNTMRLIFYPAIVGWILFGIWVSLILYRFFKVNYSKMLELYE